MTEELKPCPFCGSPAKVFGTNMVGCVDQLQCGATVDWGHYTDVSGPISAWNTRAEPKIKPLVWEYHPVGKMAGSTIGYSYILDTRKKGAVVSLKGFSPFQRRFDTLDEAQEAAQADYERRIKECLE